MDEPADPAAELDSERIERVVLIGFMAAGKSTVGRLLADRLGWRFVDTDVLVEERAGMPVPDVFARMGEARFRSAEREVSREALALRRVVVATGGGWPEQEGSLESLPARSLTVWLDAPVSELLDRVQPEGGVRPLLAVSDPVATARRLLERRRPRYARAEIRVDTSGRTPEEIADEIAEQVGRGQG